jgi:hypothetical protein
VVVGLGVTGLLHVELLRGPFPLGEVAQVLAASERPEHLKIVLDVAGP